MNDRKKNFLLAIAVILVACNLRAPLTGVGSLVGLIQENLALSASGAGMLTTIPLLAFAIVSPFVGSLCKRFGAGRLLLCSLIVLMLGMLLRSTGSSRGLYWGTAVVGIGIAVGNVLLPAVIKVYFPKQLGLMTGLYSTALSVAAGISSGISIPIAARLGWRAALSVWLLLALPTFLLCLPHRQIQVTENTGKGNPIYGSSMTWWVTLYMGVQSLLFYCFVAWLASIMQAKGYSSAVAGYFVSAYMLLGIPSSFLIPILAGRQKKQTGLGVCIGAFYLAGTILLVLFDSVPLLILSILFCSLASGASISFAIALFSLRTKSGDAASQLSGIAQSAGYLLAAIGPAALGKIFDSTQSWTLALLLLIGFSLILTIAGWFAGRDKMAG